MKLIVFEGPDASGKTKYAEGVYRDCLARQKPCVWFTHSKDFDFDKNRQAASYFNQRMNFVQSMRHFDGLVITDRWWLSNLVFTNFSEEAVNLSNKERYWEFESGVQIKMVFLDASDEQLNKRMAKRGEEVTDHDYEIRRIYRDCSKYYGAFTHDTSEVTFQEGLNNVISRLFKP